MGMYTNVSHSIRMLLRYNAWANGRLYSALEAWRGREGEAGQDDKWSGMLQTLNHANVVDRIWQAHLEGKPHGFTARNTETIPSFEVLHASQQKLDDWYIDYADTLPEEQFEEDVQFTLIGGNEGTMSRAEILLHVVNHKTYHRGYIAQSLRELSLMVPVMDLPVFLRESRHK